MNKVDSPSGRAASWLSDTTKQEASARMLAYEKVNQCNGKWARVG